MDSNKKTCANAVCDCVPPKGEKYCSAHCEGAAEKTSIVCRCGHSECGADVTIPGSAPTEVRFLAPR